MREFRFHPALLMVFVLGACLEMQAPAPVVSYGFGEGAGSTGIHTVMNGETLGLISKRYNIAARDIAVANDLDAPFYLTAGLRLKLPPPQQYKVRPGDSLNTVSRLFAVSNSEIAKMNNLRPPYKLSAGQSLRLPSVTQKSAPAVFVRAENLAAVNPIPVQAERLSAPSISRRGQTQNVLRLPEGYGQEKPVETTMAEPIQEFVVKKPEPESTVTSKIPKRSSGKFLRPVGGKIISAYGPKENGLFNDGINISTPRDTPVRAAENGVVVYAGDALKGSGNLVLIRHDDRWMTAYAHLGNIQVKKGAVIKRGQTIGTVGSTGAVDGPQLHFEIRRGTEALNPQVYLES